MAAESFDPIVIVPFVRTVVRWAVLLLCGLASPTWQWAFGTAAALWWIILALLLYSGGVNWLDYWPETLGQMFGMGVIAVAVFGVRKLIVRMATSWTRRSSSTGSASPNP